MQETPSFIPAWAVAAACSRSYQWIHTERLRGTIPPMDVRRQGWRLETLRAWNSAATDRALRIMAIAAEASAA